MSTQSGAGAPGKWGSSAGLVGLSPATSGASSDYMPHVPGVAWSSPGVAWTPPGVAGESWKLGWGATDRAGSTARGVFMGFAGRAQPAGWGRR